MDFEAHQLPPNPRSPLTVDHKCNVRAIRRGIREEPILWSFSRYSTNKIAFVRTLSCRRVTIWDSRDAAVQSSKFKVQSLFSIIISIVTVVFSIKRFGSPSEKKSAMFCRNGMTTLRILHFQPLRRSPRSAKKERQRRVATAGTCFISIVYKKRYKCGLRSATRRIGFLIAFGRVSQFLFN